MVTSICCLLYWSKAYFNFTDISHKLLHWDLCLYHPGVAFNDLLYIWLDRCWGWWRPELPLHWRLGMVFLHVMAVCSPVPPSFVAYLTLVWPLSCVQPLMNISGFITRESLFTVSARYRTFFSMPAKVGHQGWSEVKSEVTVRTCVFSFVRV